jgi:hypothetical protein
LEPFHDLGYSVARRVVNKRMEEIAAFMLKGFFFRTLSLMIISKDGWHCEQFTVTGQRFQKALYFSS